MSVFYENQEKANWYIVGYLVESKIIIYSLTGRQIQDHWPLQHDNLFLLHQNDFWQGNQ